MISITSIQLVLTYDKIYRNIVPYLRLIPAIPPAMEAIKVVTALLKLINELKLYTHIDISIVPEYIICY